MPVTMRDVAERASVSIKTVSNVLNDYPYIRPETRDRVLRAVEDLGYRMNHSARALRSGRSGAISLVVPDIRNAYFAELAAAVIDAADGLDLSVIIEQSGGVPERELQLVQGRRTVPVDGVLYSVAGLGEEDAHLLANLPTPVVLLGERIFRGPLDHVTMQNVEGARAATEHLLDGGRRRILAFGAGAAASVSSAGLRLRGYREALASRGLEADPALVVDAQPWLREGGANAMRAVLDSGVRFDGVVAFNDLIGLGALRVLLDSGVRVPDDVALVGFDDIDETRFTSPSMSTVDPGRREIAETALAFLRDRIAAGSGDDIAPREHLSRFHLRERESSRR
jgi:DNA-binding LacI/PurR family transcriptional regulator